MLKKYGKSTKRAEIFNELLKKQGRKCKCGRTQSARGVSYASMPLSVLKHHLVLHSMAINESTLSANDFELLCVSCNNSIIRRLNPKTLKELADRHRLYIYTPANSNNETPLYITHAMKKNKIGKPRAFDFLLSYLKDKQLIDYKEALRIVCGQGDVNEDTAEKWLFGWCSIANEFIKIPVNPDDKLFWLAIRNEESEGLFNSIKEKAKN